MQLDGSIIKNLSAAITSAERLRGHKVHPDTLAFWNELLAHARARKRSEPVEDPATVEHLLAALQLELAQREVEQAR